MRLVAATQSLLGVGGSEVYAITVSDHLQRLGHDVWLYAIDHGVAAEHASSLGIRVAAGPHDLPDEPDAVIVQDGVVACELASIFPHSPQVFVAHSDIFDLQLPPQLPGLVAAVVTLYDRVDRRVRAMGLELPVIRLTQPVDVERFKPRSPLRGRASAALALGNYVHGERFEALERACARNSIELNHVGTHATRTETDPREALDRADIVFGKARVIHEAMACGRAVYVYDHNGAEGWVTLANVHELAADNFGGQSRPVSIDPDRLANDLQDYDASMGIANRDFIVAHHSATKHTAQLVDVLRELAPRRTDLRDAPLREMARLVRLYHRADGQAFALHSSTQRLSARVHQLEAEFHGAHERATAEAGRAAQLEALVSTRRWRTLQALLRPLDAARTLFKKRRQG